MGVMGVAAAAWVSSSWPSRVASAVEPSRLAESLRKLRRLWGMWGMWSEWSEWSEAGTSLGEPEEFVGVEQCSGECIESVLVGESSCGLEFIGRRESGVGESEGLVDSVV